MIGGNGSYVEHCNHIIMHQLISYEQCVHIVDWLHARGLEFYLESNNGLFASERFEEVCVPTLRLYENRKGRDAQGISAHTAFPNMIYDGELYRDDLNKVSFIT